MRLDRCWITLTTGLAVAAAVVVVLGNRLSSLASGRMGLVRSKANHDHRWKARAGLFSVGGFSDVLQMIRHENMPMIRGDGWSALRKEFGTYHREHYMSNILYIFLQPNRSLGFGNPSTISRTARRKYPTADLAMKARTTTITPCQVPLLCVSLPSRLWPSQFSPSQRGPSPGMSRLGPWC